MTDGTRDATVVVGFGRGDGLAGWTGDRRYEARRGSVPVLVVPVGPSG